MLSTDVEGISERDTIVTMIGGATLSTVAIVIYPIVATALGLDQRSAGTWGGCNRSGAITRIAPPGGCNLIVASSIQRYFLAEPECLSGFVEGRRRDDVPHSKRGAADEDCYFVF